MKKLLILILFPFFSLAQIDTSHVSLKNNDLALKEEIANLKWCLRKSHQIHTKGVHKCLIGLGLMTIGAIATTGDSPELGRYVFLPVGSFLFLIGEFQIWKSHKWLKNAGMGFTKDGLTAKYTFKP